MRSVLNHVAFLVESIELVLEKNSFGDEFVGKIEEFPSEGTRELYIGKDNQVGRLLLMQAIGDGPYKRALDKRGPGLHHIALDVINIDEFVSSLNGSGWMLHPISLEYYKNNKQVYLCRSGTPVLMEIQERKELTESDFLVNQLEFPFEKKSLLEELSCKQLIMGDFIKLLDKKGEQICQSLT